MVKNSEELEVENEVKLHPKFLSERAAEMRLQKSPLNLVLDRVNRNPLENVSD